MFSNMARVMFKTRPIINLLQRASVSPRCQHCTYSMLRVLDSHTTVLRDGFRVNLDSTVWNVHPVRHLMKASKKREQQLKEQDQIPGDYEIIYRAPLTGYTQFGQIVSYLSLGSLGGFCLFRLYTDSIHEFPFSLFQAESSNALNMNSIQASLMLVFFLSVNIVFQKIALSYPLRIYRKGDMFILVSRSFLPYIEKQEAFTKGDIKPGGSKVFRLLWSDAVFSLAGNTVLILEEYFRTPQDFQDMFES